MPRTHAIDAPLPTVTSHGAGALVEPVVEPLSGPVEPVLVQIDHAGSHGVVRSVWEPVPTIITKQNIGLVVPHLSPVGEGESLHSLAASGRLWWIDGILHRLDILFRMLTNGELARAMSLDDEAAYEFVGTAEQVTRQIGNAVPVETATALVSVLMAPEARAA